MTALVLDGNSLYAQAFYAANGSDPSLYQPDDGWRLALKLFRRICDEHAPDTAAACWDGVNTSKNDKGRDSKPAQYHEEKEQFKDELEIRHGVVNVCDEVHEADDLVASVVHRVLQETDDQVVVVSADKDLRQLASKRVKYHCLTEKAVLSTAWICRKYNIGSPKHLAIWLALVGDSSDKISGVPGMGPAKTKKLLQECQAQDSVSMGELADRVFELLPPKSKAHFEQSLELTLLDRELDVPLPAKFRWSA